MIELDILMEEELKKCIRKSEKLFYAKNHWSEKDKIASILEKKEKSILGILIGEEKLKNSKISVNMAEHLARASSDFQKHIDEMVEARYQAHLAWARVERIREEIKENERADIKTGMNLKYSNGEGSY